MSHFFYSNSFKLKKEKINFIKNSSLYHALKNGNYNERIQLFTLKSILLYALSLSAWFGYKSKVHIQYLPLCPNQKTND